MELPNKIQKQFESVYAPSSINIFKSMFKRLAKDMGREIIYSNDIIKSHEEVLEVAKSYPYGSQRPLISAILFILKKSNIKNKKELIEIYSIFMKNLKSSESVATYETNLTKDVISWDTVLSINRTMGSTYVEYLDYIIYKLYTLIPCLRPSEWLHVNFSDTSNNTIQSDKLILKKYKTVKFYGEKHIQLPEELCTIISEWHAYTASDWLIPLSEKDKSRHMTIHTFVQRILKIFGALSSELRKSYINYHSKNKTIEERISMADSMNHSLTAQRFTYTTG